jgi:uncharacterized pyridoxamine 5'-phosphate oxidase family protein
MEEIVNFLKENKIFYVSTIDGDKPKVRPFGFVMMFEDKLCFTTNKLKQCSIQMKANPNVEICACSSNMELTMEWVRIIGRAVFFDSIPAKEKAFEIMPALKEGFKTADNPNYELFYLENAICEFHTLMGGVQKTIQF